MASYDEIVQGSWELGKAEALRLKHGELTPAHLFFGLVGNPRSVTSKNLQHERKVLEGLLESLPQVGRVEVEQIKPSPRLQEWFALAHSEAVKAGRDETREADFLKHLTRFFPQVSQAGLDNLEEGENSEIPDFLVDLNALATDGKLDPVIGRSAEIRKVMEILCRRTKNNPVLIGQPGVGKTAIVEGLADLIVKRRVSEVIQDKTVYAMNMGNLMSNTKYRGEFEEKIQSMIGFLKSKNREAILFIDEIHLLVGAGKTEGGAMDAANLLKPALARGELNCIGATTFEEYKQFIEADSALERRFHQVKVNEPTKEDTIQILMGLKEKYEIHHGIEITEAAIVAAVYFSSEYISDRFLPDKAIDVIDEASATLKLSADSLPPEIQELDALIRSKKVLLNTQQEDKALQEEIARLVREHDLAMEDWNRKNSELKRAATLKSKLDEAQFRYNRAESEGDYATASRVMYGEMPELRKQLETMEISHKLDREQIAEAVSKNTGVPKERILKSRQENILGLSAFVKGKVFGQDRAVDEIADTLIASHAGLTDPGRPLGSFLLIGPSGVGKTETAKTLAEYLFQSEKNLVRFDLSEFRESHAVAKLIGAPPGYVGYDKGGTLTEAVRRKPYSVLLFDEVEKAHADFADILLQILDDGRLTDSQGRTVNFKNTVIMVTSNLKDYEAYLKPELIGRFDGILHFSRLSFPVIRQLVARELETLNGRLAQKQLEFAIDEELTKKIIARGFDERYGARPLKNAFGRMVARPVSKFLMAEEEPKGQYLLLYDETAGIGKIQKVAGPQPDGERPEK